MLVPMNSESSQNLLKECLAPDYSIFAFIFYSESQCSNLSHTIKKVVKHKMLKNIQNYKNALTRCKLLA